MQRCGERSLFWTTLSSDPENVSGNEEALKQTVWQQWNECLTLCFSLCRRFCEWSTWRVATPCSLTWSRDKCPHRRPSLDRRHIGVAGLAIYQSFLMDHCPILMSTKHPWTDKSRLKWHFQERKGRNNKNEEKKELCCAEAARKTKGLFCCSQPASQHRGVTDILPLTGVRSSCKNGSQKPGTSQKNLSCTG